MNRQLPVVESSPLPPLYAGWIDQLLAGPIPRETDATCDDCAMLPQAGQAAGGSGVFFNPETKCCSYVPQLPNYLVGRTLVDDDPAFATGRATVAARLHAGIAVSPLGLGPPPDFQVLYGHSAATLFGQSRSLLCPHYLAAEGGRCGVWKHRAAVCATWHCKYVRGAVGQQFWASLLQLLAAVETSLSQWCVLELDVGPDALTRLFPVRSAGRGSAVSPRALDGLPDPVESRMLWGNWFGREAEFYRECARLVNALDWSAVIAISGAEVQIFAQLLRQAYAKLLSQTIPARLKIGSIQMVGMDQDSCLITSYNPNDPLSVPRQLIDVFGYFGGRTTDQALAAIADAEGIRLDPQLLRKLTDFSVLVPVPEEPPEGLSGLS